MKRHLVLAILLLAPLSGCGFDLLAFLRGTNNPPAENANLRQFTSDAELKSYLIDQSGYGERNAYPGVVPSPDFADDADGMGAEAPSDQTAGESAGDDQSPDFSTTTEQEEGVQEADIVKSDGEYFYVLTSGALRIVKAHPAESLAESGALELDGWGAELFLVGDRVVAITNPDDGQVYFDGVAEDLIAPSYYYWQPQTLVSIIDVSDRTNPHVVSQVRIDGSTVASRMIGEKLYLVVSDYLNFFYELNAGAEQPIEDVPLSDLLPDISVTVNDEEVVNGDIARSTDHFRPDDADGLGLTNILSIDINAPADYHAQTVVGYPANVYASTQALYLTNTAWNVNGDQRETTSIYKFAFTDEGAALAASGTVPGRVLNQYSMSEYNGFLRIATTLSPTWVERNQQESQNAVYVLEQSGDSLEEAGAIENIAPGEVIYSARFLGDKGYLVTFEQIDPLFTLDMSDPRNPRKVGELKVPGFSTFITPLGEDHLLTIGRDTNDFGFSDGIRLSIFDVSDFANPTVAHIEVIGSNGAWSDAVYNPKAFTYFPEEDLIAFPLEIYSYGIDVDVIEVDAPDVGPTDGDAVTGSAGQASSLSGGSSASSPGVAVAEPEPTEPIGMPEPAPLPGDTDEPLPADDPVDELLPPAPDDHFFGLAVYRATAEGGFEPLGRISTAREDGGYYYYGPWFTRGLFIGDMVYAVTSDGVSASRVTAVETKVAHIDFPTDDPMPVDGADDNGTNPEPGPTEPTPE